MTDYEYIINQVKKSHFSGWDALLFKDRIEERDRKIKAMNVDELIENLHDENGYGKFIVLEMKERFDSLEDSEKMKIINTLMSTTKANKSWAEGKLKKIDSEK